MKILFTLILLCQILFSCSTKNKISRIKNSDSNAYLNGLVLESIGEELSHKRMIQILDKLISDGIISKEESEIVDVALSEDSLSMPFTIKDKIRAKAFKNILLKLMTK